MPVFAVVDANLDRGQRTCDVLLDTGDAFLTSLTGILDLQKEQGRIDAIFLDASSTTDLSEAVEGLHRVYPTALLYVTGSRIPVSLWGPLAELGVKDFVSHPVTLRRVAQLSGFDFEVTAEKKSEHRVSGKQKKEPGLNKEQKSGTIVAFAGLLPTGGGVGKDAWVINTATWLASQGKTVAVVDLDTFGTLKDRFKLETTLSVDLWEEHFMDIPLSPETIKSALVYVRVKKLGFWLLPASTEGRMQSDATIQHMGQWLPQVFDVVIWNLGSGIAGKSFLSALHQADHIFLIGTGDRAKFKSYQKTFEDYQEMVSVEPKIIFNKFYEKDAPQFFEQDFGHPVFAYALEDRRVFELNEQGKVVVLEQPKSQFGLAVQKTGREILGEPGEEKPKKGGWLFGKGK